MAKPTVQEVRDQLEGFSLDTSILSDGWIERTRDNSVIPIVEGEAGLSVTTEQTVTEFYSGNGEDILILDRKPIIELIGIAYTTVPDDVQNFNITAINVDKPQGILKSISGKDYTGLSSSVFRRGIKNIKVTYKVGYDNANLPADIKQVILLRTCISALTLIANRTGGGNNGVKAYSPVYGDRGKYTNIRNEWSREAKMLLSKYGSAVVGM